MGENSKQESDTHDKDDDAKLSEEAIAAFALSDISRKIVEDETSNKLKEGTEKFSRDIDAKPEDEDIIAAFALYDMDKQSVDDETSDDLRAMTEQFARCDIRDIEDVKDQHDQPQHNSRKERVGKNVSTSKLRRRRRY